MYLKGKKNIIFIDENKGLMYFKSKIFNNEITFIIISSLSGVLIRPSDLHRVVAATMTTQLRKEVRDHLFRAG